jgi:type IV pilus assembly protein PilB
MEETNLAATPVPENTKGIEAKQLSEKNLFADFVSRKPGDPLIGPSILDAIFLAATDLRASDIHIESQTDLVVVRYRIDGVLHMIGNFPKPFYENVLNRIKVQSHLRTDEHFSAQDGSLRYKIGEQQINVRVSILPTLDGEKTVMRLLTEYVGGYSMEFLGLSKQHQTTLVTAASKPFGMILVVGPTGSGKTTTLYSLLKELNRPDVNITTIEDPVEYKIVGVNHIQVNPQTNLTFAEGLRSIVRQDPDVIFLGEIRDKESAEIAVNAALTGHLLLSTFHANNAATAIPRLLDMGIERFLLSSTLQLVISQTLVRRNCKDCTIDYQEIDPRVLKYAGTDKLKRGKGCKTCAGTGYKGRVALYEFIKNSPTMQELILKSPSTREVFSVARKEGFITMFEDGMDKVRAGQTTFEEVNRVCAPPDENQY